MLLSLFPNGLLPDGHMNSFHEGDTYPVDVSFTFAHPASPSKVDSGYQVRPCLVTVHARFLSDCRPDHTFLVTIPNHRYPLDRHEHARIRKRHAAGPSRHHRSSRRSRLLCYSTQGGDRPTGDDRGEAGGWQSASQTGWHFFRVEEE